MITHDLPETWSDERMHILDETCWCKPEPETFIPADGSETETVLHHHRPTDEAALDNLYDIDDETVVIINRMVNAALPYPGEPFVEHFANNTSAWTP